MVRLGFIIGFIALIGVLLSGLAAYRVHDQELAIDGIALSRAIDVHASLVQDRLTERELLARVASGLFRAPSVVKANMLQPLRSAIYAFKTDFVIASWIARLKPADLAAAQAELKSAGFTNPTIRDFDDQPLDIKAIDKPLDVLMDLEPRSRGYAGLSGPRLRPALGDRADAGAGGGDRQAGGVGPDPAAAAERADRPRARVARSEGRHRRARRLRHLFLRAGAADADQRRPLAVFGGAEGPR